MNVLIFDTTVYLDSINAFVIDYIVCLQKLYFFFILFIECLVILCTLNPFIFCVSGYLCCFCVC